MTVIAWDGKTLAVDKMATNAGCKSRTTKIRKIPTGEVLAWCGSSENGLAMAAWYENGADPKAFPASQNDKENWAVLVVVRGRECFEYEQLPFAQRVEDPFAAWGSGRDFALGALGMGADAIEAVDVASRFSITCGMGVDAYDVETEGRMSA